MFEWNWIFDNMKRNVLYEETWKNEIFDNMKRNALCEETCDSIIWDGIPYAKKLITRWYETECSNEGI